MPPTTFPSPLSWFLWAHIGAGLIALLTFIVPLLTAKGGKNHVRSGWIYAIAMVIVAISAFVLTPWRFYFDLNATEDQKSFSLFLFFISLFSLTTLQQGLHVFKHKKRKASIKNSQTLALPLLLLIVSTGVFIVGARTNSPLFMIFPAVAGRTAYKQIQYWKAAPPHSKDWFFFHLENMFTCSIATVTAFLVTALPRLVPNFGTKNVFVWLAPTFIMIPWSFWFQKRYERKFGVKAP